MDIKYKVIKLKNNNTEEIKDSVSIEEPLEMILKFMKNGKWQTENISITMRTPGNDEDLIAGFLYNEKIVDNIEQIKKIDVTKSVLAGLFSTITIGALTLLTYKTELGIFLIASFGSSMVLLFGYPESPFAQPKNIFFGHLLTSMVGVIFLYLVPLPVYLLIPLAVGFGVTLMIFLNVTHPPAGGNPIIVIMGSVSLDYLVNPIIIGSLIILAFGVILNRLILKKKYPL